MQTTPKTIFAGIMLMTALGCDDGAADRIENRAKCREICSQVKSATMTSTPVCARTTVSISR